jgi:PAS domain S-box-containing protein
MACVAKDGKFIWVNQAFELLVGYSLAELIHKKWQDITVQEDVGGDLASARAILDGETDSYTISKRYRHKRGHEVAVQLTVWRFPPSAAKAMVCFTVEAVPEKASKQELQTIKKQLGEEIDLLKRRFQLMDSKDDKFIEVNYNSQNADGGGGSNRIGDDTGNQRNFTLSFPVFCGLAVSFAAVLAIAALAVVIYTR